MEKGFGILRQVSGPNDHPTTSTFVQLYQMLSLYSKINPPKSGNCSILEDKCDVIHLLDMSPIISMKNLKDIINDPETISQREQGNNLTALIKNIFKKYIAKRLVNETKCLICIEGITNLNTLSVSQEAALVQAK
ncbi:Uncharacterized protein FWK35_00024380, partial [Aphis craccivora]